MKFRITLTGTTGLLLHNARMANPLDPIVRDLKRITGKRKKTDQDHEDMARLEFAGSLYCDPDLGPYLPAQNFERFLYDGATISRRGELTKQGVFVLTDVNPLSYSGPRTPDALWSDQNFRLMASAKVDRKRVMRCRPLFRQWRVDAEGELDDTILSLNELQDIATVAGQRKGIGDWRPRYGRCTAVVEKI